MKEVIIKKLLSRLAVMALPLSILAIPTAADAAVFQGKIASYVHDTTSLSPYGITLVAGPQLWLRADAYFVSCTSASISDGSKISMTNLGRIKLSNKTIKIVSSYTQPTYIACL